MGVVYLAADETDRRVAVKTVHAHLAEDDEIRRRFAREAENARHVRTAFTPLVLDSDVLAATPYLVSEFVDGPNLSREVLDRGTLSSPELWQLSVNVLAALDAFHRAGIIHRDIKPSNIILSRTGPRVIDFGISRALGDLSGLTGTSGPPGTPSIMAPELWRGERGGPAVDVFAWGCLITYAGTARWPFIGTDGAALRHSILHDPPILDGLDDGIRILVDAALRKEADKRPSPAELLLRLDDLARSESSTAAASGEAERGRSMFVTSPTASAFRERAGASEQPVASLSAVPVAPRRPDRWARRLSGRRSWSGPGSRGRDGRRTAGANVRAVLVVLALAAAFGAVYLIGRGHQGSPEALASPTGSPAETSATGPSAPSGPATATQATATPSATSTRLASGDLLLPAQALVSPDGRFRAMLESDGNLYVRDDEGDVVWQTFAEPGGRYLNMQFDGNIVVSRSDNRPVWASNSSERPGSYLDLTDEGTLELRGPGGSEVWAGTYSNALRRGESLLPGNSIESHNGRYRLQMRDDGNLVLDGPGGESWESMTAGRPGARLTLGEDGVLALYDSDGNEIELVRKPFPDVAFEGALLEVQNDGNVVLSRIAHHPEWATDTSTG